MFLARHISTSPLGPRTVLPAQEDLPDTLTLCSGGQAHPDLKGRLKVPLSDFLLTTHVSHAKIKGNTAELRGDTYCRLHYYTSLSGFCQVRHHILWCEQEEAQDMVLIVGFKNENRYF